MFLLGVFPTWRGTRPALVFSLFLALLIPGHNAITYNDSMTALDNLMSASRYSKNIRPLEKQEDTLYIASMFELVSLVEVNDIVQSFTCNGFLILLWNDQILRWDPADYNGEFMITPDAKDVFRPRLLLLNTMGERDLLKDETGVVNVYSDGTIFWIPGSVFPASCQLDLTYYPYDEQECKIELVPFNFGPTQLQFFTFENEVGTGFFFKNGEWDVVNASITTPLILVNGDNISTIQLFTITCGTKQIGNILLLCGLIDFRLKRKPAFLVVSMLLPIVFLSLLNLLVFLIPVDSGEKISYGITVLLALSVFMSIMSAMLPRSAETMPLVIIYIFILLAISVMTVVDSIVIVKLHHMEEKEESSQRAKQNFTSILSRINTVRQAVSPLEKKSPGASLSPANSEELKQKADIQFIDINANGAGSEIQPPTPAWPSKRQNQPQVNKYKIIGKYIDIVSFVVFLIIWSAVTIGFMVAITSR